MKEKNIRGWLIVVTSFVVLMFVFAACISCMGIYLKPVCEEFGIQRTAYTLITTIQALALLVFSMIAGKLLDKYNVKLLMALGVAACAVCMLIYSIAPSISVFYAASVFMGIGIAFSCNIPINILINSWFDSSKKGFALGIAFVGSGVGAMILNPLLTSIITDSGWRMAYRTSGILMLVIVLPLVLFIVKRKEEIKTEGEQPGAGAAHEDDYFTLSDAMKKPAFWMVFLGYIIVTFASLALVNHAVPFLTDTGFSPEKAAMIISAASAAIIGGKIVAGGMYSKIGTFKATIVEVILTTACVLTFCLSGLTQSMLFIVLYVILYGIGIPIATMSMTLVINVMFPKCDFGAIMGFLSMSTGLAGMLQVVISMSYDTLGSYYPAWIGTCILCIAALVLFIISVRPQHKRFK